MMEIISYHKYKQFFLTLMVITVLFTADFYFRYSISVSLSLRKVNFFTRICLLLMIIL
jgi:hypothetical protein